MLKLSHLDDLVYSAKKNAPRASLLNEQNGLTIAAKRCICTIGACINPGSALLTTQSRELLIYTHRTESTSVETVVALKAILIRLSRTAQWYQPH